MPPFRKGSSMRCILLVVAALWAACPSLTAADRGATEPVGAGDWPHWRGPHFDGVSRETGLLREWPEGGPRVLWKVSLPGGYSSVAVVGDRLYTHTARDKKEEIVLCLEAATGKELWRHAYP